MTTSFLRRAGAAASIALALSFGLAACGDDSDDSSSTPEVTTSTPAGTDAGATFGAGCALIPKDGKGSFNGMASDPVATAASNNPLLSTLVAAVKAAGLVDTLNGGTGWTVFAPINDAFAALPAGTVDTLLKPANKDKLGGEYTTVAGDKITVTGNATDGFVVNGKTVKSNVVCGNVQTGNATVYIIDTVLTD